MTDDRCENCGHSRLVHLWDDCIGARGLCRCICYVAPTFEAPE